jgi:hypothetical protein
VIEISPDNIIEFDVHMVDDKIFFRRFFCSFRPYIEGFLVGCRPYLSVDSRKLNGRWCGQLATTCGFDGHNWMYPVAFGFIGSKIEDNWKWFIEHLRKAIGDPPLLAVSSDTYKGLENTVKVVFPHVEQRECFRHLMKNYVKRYGGAENIYPAARAYRKIVHDHYKAIVRSKTYIARTKREDYGAIS